MNFNNSDNANNIFLNPVCVLIIYVVLVCILCSCNDT